MNNRIKIIREEFGISQADLCRRLGWKQSRVSNYEANIRTPNLVDSRGILAALVSLGAQCTLESLFPLKSGEDSLATLNDMLPVPSGDEQSCNCAVDAYSPGASA